MKNFDIENLERKNIYKIPDHFFDEMQTKVLQETSVEKKGKIINLNWAYGAAAAVALVFGVTFFTNQNSQETPVLTQTVAANSGENAVETSAARDIQKTEATLAYKTLENDLTFAENNYQKENERSVRVAKAASADVQKNEITPKTAEVQVDQVLSSFTSAELADLGKNAEQDIYLDLYN